MEELKIKGEIAKYIIDESEKAGLSVEQYLFSQLLKKKKKRIELLPLSGKARIAEVVVESALRSFSKTAVIWSGGKDSTLVLYFVKKVCEDNNIPKPDAVVIDHYMHFEETIDFISKVSKDWKFNVLYKGNERLKGRKYGEIINIDELDESDKGELEKIGYKSDKFEYALNNIAANHLLKTVPMKELVKERNYEALFIGIRWDENPARADETFFSRREDHFRIHPILTFTERDVWNFTIKNNLPIHPLYYKGYRSIDDKYETKRFSDKPAWEQDLESTDERQGRAQDKENIMELLRKFGYM
jgi:phosphoadenosine phosphosulfate reductase